MNMIYLICAISIGVLIIIILILKNIKKETFEKQSSYPYLASDYPIMLTNNTILNSSDNFNFDVSTNPIIFVKSDLLRDYIDDLLKLEKKYSIITTSNDDICMPYVYFPCKDIDTKNKYDSLLNHKYLNKWYTKNPSILHEKLVPLPIGPKMQWYSTDFFGEDKTNTLILYNKYYLEAEKLFRDVQLKTKLVYTNMSSNITDDPYYKPHTNIRNKVIEHLKNKFEIISGGKSSEDFIKDLRTYKFCVSPPGRGIDCHRTWESLMVGTIPICLSSTLNPIYTDLPVLIVDDYSIIDTEYLEDQYQKMIQKKYDFSKIYCDYWKDRILNQK
jgi:hypothetical protein